MGTVLFWHHREWKHRLLGFSYPPLKETHDSHQPVNIILDFAQRLPRLRLLHRLRTDSSFTNQTLHLIEKAAIPYCQPCGEAEDIHRVL